MLSSYEAIYENGQLHWLNESPNRDNVKVIVTLLEPVSESTADIPNGRELAQLLEEMAAVGVADAFGDPLEWQSQTRQDKILPGREEP